MRKVIVFSAVLGSIIALFPSCSKQSQSEMVLQPTGKVINASVASNSSYQLTLANWDNATITKQALHFKSSGTATDVKSGYLVYRYSPAANYTGPDEVVLTTKTVNSSTGMAGGCHHGDGQGSSSTAVAYTYTTTTIKFTVTN